jgi:KaiC/GvpD/RAD55 family RecA-like ATPase
LAEYVADGVIALRNVEVPDKNEMQLTLRVVKMRRIRHSRRITPYGISAKGIEVHAGAEL